MTNPAHSRIRRTMSAVAGAVLLPGTWVEAYFQSFGFYKEHYVWPRGKYGIVTTLRWRDIFFLVVFWAVALMLSYLSYRLLRYAARSEA
jgi:hypothetical protein